MLKGIKVRLDPTPSQERRLAANAGGARFAYNFMLRRVKASLSGNVGRVEWSHYSLRREWNAWKDDVAPWWRENSKESYSYGLECLAKALKNWADSRRGRRSGRRVGFPRLKSRKTMIRFAYTTGGFGVADEHGVKLPRIGRVHCMENIAARVHGLPVKRITISKQTDGWYASLLVDVPDPTPTGTLHGSVGVDLGVKHLAALSDGTFVDNTANDRKLDGRIRRTQRSLSRSVKGSNRNRRKTLRLAKLNHRKANRRRDMLDKLTTRLADTYAIIGIEDLNVAGMTRRPKPKPDPDHEDHYLPNGAKAKSGLSRRILGNSFGMFRSMLEYKCARTGALLIVNDRYYASSKTCANCGRVKTKLPLNERTYVCEACGFVCDRDLNAAMNLNPVAMSAIGDVKRARRTTKTPTQPAHGPKPPTREGNANQAADNTGMLGADHGNAVMQLSLL